MAMKDRFANIFGGDAAEDFFSSSPTLAQVLPQLVNTDRTGEFSVAELNKRAEGVRGGRKTRAARTRSANAFLPREIAERMQNTTIFDERSAGPDNTQAMYDTTGPTYDYGDQTRSPGGDVGMLDGGGQVPNAVMGQIGNSMLTSGLLNTAAMTAMGVDPTLTGIVGSMIPSPMSLMNTIGGGIYSHYAGESAGGGYQDIQDMADTYGNPYDANDPFGEYSGDDFDLDAATEDAKVEAMSRGGLIGNIGRDLAASIGDLTGMYDMDSTRDLAMNEIMSQSIQPGAIGEQQPLNIDGTINPNYNLPGAMQEYDPMAKQPGMIEAFARNIGLGKGLTANDIAGAGSIVTESGALGDSGQLGKGGFSEVNNVSNQYERTGTDPFGEATYGDINEPGGPAGQIEGTEVDIADAQPQGLTETPSNVVDNAPPVASNLQAQNLPASNTGSDAARAKEAAEAKAAAEKQSAIETAKSNLAAAQGKYNQMSSKARDNQGGTTRRAIEKYKNELQKLTGKTYEVIGNQYSGYVAREAADLSRGGTRGGYDFYGNRRDGGGGGYTGSGRGTGGGRGGEYETESGGYGGRGGV